MAFLIGNMIVIQIIQWILGYTIFGQTHLVVMGIEQYPLVNVQKAIENGDL